MMNDRTSKPTSFQRLIQYLGTRRIPSKLLARILHRVDGWLLRLTRGRSCASKVLAGLPVALVTTIGAKSGISRKIPLLYISHGDNLVLVASNFGRRHHPAWFYNIRAHPRVTVSIQNHTRTYIVREAEGKEYQTLWSQVVSIYAWFDDYRRRAGARRIPIFVLEPA